MANVGQSKPLSAKALRERSHVHAHLGAVEQAKQCTSGTIDVHLLRDAGLHVPQELTDCEKVRVKFAFMQSSPGPQSQQPVFETYAQDGQFIGHYFSAAFKTLVH